MNTRHPPGEPSALNCDHRLATVIAFGCLAVVSALFLRSGRPVTAERVCADRAYVSEREHCMQEWIAAARQNAVAGK